MTTVLERAAASPGNASNISSAEKKYDRQADDIGNIQGFDHINLVIPDQQLATIFYVMGLGYTRDPHARVGIYAMGINVGRSQFHLATAARIDLPGRVEGSKAAAQRLRGTIGLVVPDLAGLTKRLNDITPLLKGTQFSFQSHDSYIDVTCPWGNRFRCHAPGAEYGEDDRAIAYIEFDVPRGTAAGIARFYRDVLLGITSIKQQGNDAVARVQVGGTYKLLFHETDAPMAPYDDHHIAIYVANHSAPHRALQEQKVRVEENNAHQYRFRDIVDPENGRQLFQIEHEVRSLRHPMFNKPLVNRDSTVQ